MSSEIFEAVEQLSRAKGIDPNKVIQALEEAVAAAAKRNFRSTEDIVARFDRETGIMQAFARMRVVDDVVDEECEIDIDEAKMLKPDAKPGDELLFPRPTVNLGRIAAQQAKQVIFQKVREAERENIFGEYKGRVDELITGTVKRFEKGDVIIDLGRTEALLPRREQSRAERYSIGDRMRAVIVKVEEAAKGPQVIVSRTSAVLLHRLFEMEVPEIYDGTVRVMGCVREPGERAKVAVKSESREIDPVGACVGIKGSRVQAIIRELRGEKIDIVPWSPEPLTLLMNALNPARVNRVEVRDKEQGIVEVSVDDDQLSLAIGKKGQNVRLASKLTGWKIEVHGEREKRESAERELRLLSEAPKKLQALPGIDEAKAQILMHRGIRTWGEFLDEVPRTIMDALEITDDAMEGMLEAAERLEEERIEQERVDAERRVAEAAAQVKADAAAAVVAAEAAAAVEAAAAAEAASAGASHAAAAGNGAPVEEGAVATAPASGEAAAPEGGEASGGEAPTAEP